MYTVNYWPSLAMQDLDAVVYRATSSNLGHAIAAAIEAGIGIKEREAIGAHFDLDTTSGTSGYITALFDEIARRALPAPLPVAKPAILGFDTLAHL